MKKIVNTRRVTGRRKKWRIRNRRIAHMTKLGKLRVLARNFKAFGNQHENKTVAAVFMICGTEITDILDN